MCAIYHRCRLWRFRGCLASTAAVEALAAGVVEAGSALAGGATLAISLPHTDLSLASLSGPNDLCECVTGREHLRYINPSTG